MEPRKFSGKTVDEATDNALEALDANREDVEIVVVSPGRSGILGFGGEPAEIEVTLLESAGAGVAARVPEPPAPPAASLDEEPENEDDEAPGEEEPARRAPAGVSVLEEEEAEEGDYEYEYDDADEDDGEEDDADEDDGEEDDGDEPAAAVAAVAPARRGPPPEPDPEVIEFASEVIDYFLASMSVVADTYIREESEDGVPVFEIEGEDSGLLIGRRGETLQSLQYLVNLIVANQLGRSAYVQIDIEGYKERRRETLTGVARRTAARVVDTGEAIELEPMPAYERRWVHMALADNPDVRTESSGEGDDRFVVVYPRNGDGGTRRARGRGGRRRRR